MTYDKKTCLRCSGKGYVNKKLCSGCRGTGRIITVNHGGPREGAGRPRKYGEETTTIAFRVPVGLVEIIQKYVDRLLKKRLKNVRKK